MFNVKKMTITALLIAFGVILPMAFHAIPNAGSIFLPMHIPVLLCGIVCGFPYGLICGILAPVLSGILTGMPPAAILPSMTFELAVYGLVSSLLIRFVCTKNTYANIYIALIGAMLSGRLVSGLLNALIFRAGSYSVQMWTASAFVTAFPGIIIQIVFVPVIIIALQKAKLIEKI